MFNRFLLRRSQTVLLGEVGYFRFTIELDEPHSQSDAELWSFAREMDQRIKAEANEIVKQILGSSFEIRVSYGIGSLEIIILLTTAYTVFATYIDFSDSLNRALTQLKNLFERLFRRGPLHLHPVTIKGTSSLGQATARSQVLPETSSPMDANRLLISYVIIAHTITHLSLLGAFIWLIFSRL